MMSLMTASSPVRSPAVPGQKHNSVKKVPAGSSGGSVMVARITAKGLHTHLRTHVQITGDGRFAFAGVLRGSSEMVAVDMSR